MTGTADAVRRYVESAVAGGGMPGAAWWVEGPGGVISRGAVGWSAVEPEREPVAEDTPYDLASLTKPLATALLAAILEADGLVDLESPCGEQLAELEGSPWSGATLLELGTHRAGLPAWEPLYASGGTIADYLGAIRRLPPAGPRGQELYSDLGYIVLGAAVERRAGVSLDVLFRERIASPLALTRTGFPGGAGPWRGAAPTERGNDYERRLAGPRARGYPYRESVIRGEVHDVNAFALGGVAGHAGLFGTAGEVARIAREILVPSGSLRGLTPRARRRLLRGCVPGSGRTFGMVFAAGSVAAAGVLPPSAPGHVGFTGTSVWVLPEEAAALVLLTNRVHPVVASADFQPVRLGFHRAALEALRPWPPGVGRGHRLE